MSRPPPLPKAVSLKKASPSAAAQSPAAATLAAKKTLTRAAPDSQTAGAAREVARAHAHVKAENLVELRREAVVQNVQRYDTRLVDLICQELKIDFANDELGPKRQAANSDHPQPTPQLHALTAPPPPVLAHARHEAAVKAASAVELIEKIEAFVKSARPGLAITLDGSLGARVEIERLGPKEVALRLVGKNGPPPPEDIGRIREEMRARGLKVGALSVA